VFTVQSSPKAIGVTVAPVLNLDWRLSGWNLGVQGGPLAATRRYDAYFYSVAQADATAGRPAYDAPGGAAGWQAGLSSSRRFANWWLGAYARVDSVANAAFEPSPLVRQRQTYSFGFAASWVFKTSDAYGAASR
jgi:outer membrane scaffolding protein for murein synthesis (MipA/OmpV family)